MSDFETYCDQLGNRSRPSWAVVVGPGDSLVEFCESVSVGVKIIDTTSNRAGKWSSTTYKFILPNGARLVSGHQGWETGTWREALSKATERKVVTWLDAAEALGVSVASVMTYARRWQRADANHFDEVDRKMAEADDAASANNTDVTEVVVNFGSPTNRAAREGYWEWPLVIRDDQRRVVGHLHRDDDGNYCPDPALPAVVVLDIIKTAGYHGGHVSVRLALPLGWTAAHEPQTVW